LISNITAYVFLALPPTGTPSVVSASPNAASGAAQTFVLTYSDTGGTDALQFVSVDFNASLTAAHGCSVRYEQAYYNQANSALYLYNDAGTAVMGPLVPGSSGTLANSQCTINGSSTTVTTSGNNLVLNLSVTASSGFEGPKNIYMYAADNSPAVSGWVNKGTWTPSAAFVPSVVSASPNPASGASQNFALTYSDTGGYGVLTSVGALFNTTLSSKKACYVYYVPQTNLLYLQSDSGQGATSITPGSGTLSNSQCTIDGSSTSVATSGNDLTLNLAVAASSSFEGPKNIYMYAADNTSGTTGWVKEGTWTPSASFVPSIVSVSPNPASGAAQNFVLTYSDTGGSGALTAVAVLFNAKLSSQNACYVYYVPQSNLLYLQNDSGQGATSITPGSGTLSNGQCTINGSSTSVGTSGNNLTLNLAVTASSSFEGLKNIYMYAADSSSASTGWAKEGTWTPSPAFMPSVVSASPNPAVGPSQNFVLTYSDTGGYAALTSVAALFNSSLSSKNACYVYYVPQTNLLYLQNDNGEGATSITPGSGTLANGQCTINGSSTSVVTSGNNLTLNLAVMGSVSFTGIQNIYMRAADDSGASTGWVNEGTWAP